MHDLQRRAYLQAMGIDTYISRAQLPGAAPSRKLALVRKPGPAATEAAPVPAPAIARIDLGDARPAPGTPPATVDNSTQAPAPAPGIRLCLAAIVCGNILWLENSGDQPLATEQVGLVRAMTRAIATASGLTVPQEQAADVSRFEWPMHNNIQLDNSEEAARAGLQAFVERRLELQRCRALVILGSDCGAWITASNLSGAVIETLATAQMLSEPACKAQVWRDLQPLCAPH